jgi:thiol-disulfide isomerase/thioredoxin
MKKLLLAAALIMAAVLHVNAEDLDSLYAKELLPIGTVAPKLVINDDNITNYMNLNAEGHYTVIDFWATWCPDCRKDVSKMKALYQEFDSDSICFQGVSFDTDTAKLHQFTRDNGIEWPQYCEQRKWKETQVSKDYHIQWIPTYYILDPERRVVFRTVQVEKLRKQLRKLDMSKVDKRWKRNIMNQAYKGGEPELMNFLIKNVHYPMRLAEWGFGGKVMLDFIVNRDGSITDLKVAKCTVTDPRPGSFAAKYNNMTTSEQNQYRQLAARMFSTEAVRVLRASEGNWQPIEIEGRKFRIKCNLPITFRVH